MKRRKSGEAKKGTKNGAKERKKEENTKKRRLGVRAEGVCTFRRLHAAATRNEEEEKEEEKE
ncbi:hypothetical protein WN51_01502 [Melipona quadrifasciata]|uniref:Uncharacterized protein n=1 Tax=Melipona quadrifasciata TaxID=166423 RepID=A0A0M8ZYU8_9HYME|nr:hypothetical protein WN51_01502 [Melipona quadrifasciata]